MVVGNANGTVTPGNLGPGDSFIKSRLEDSLGHTVLVRYDTATGPSLRTSAESSDLVIIVESVTSTSLANKLKSITTPVLNYEAFIQDDMGFTASGSPGPSCDPGPPSTPCTYGAVANHDRLRIRLASHPLAAGLVDTVIVYSVTNLELTWGTVAATADVVATLVDDTTGAVIYVYQPGDTLFDGTLAAGLRIGYFLEDDNVTGTPNFMTVDGLALFDAAVAYAMGGPVSLLPGGGIRPEGSRRPNRYSPETTPGFRGRDARGRVLPEVGPGAVPRQP